MNQQKDRKTIGVLLPCYNESGNVSAIAEEIVALFGGVLSNYDYTIVFIDNCSSDGTQDELRQICKMNQNIRAIFNSRNFSYASTWHGVANTPGDCVITIPSDFQVPVSVIPSLVSKWENGHDVVCLIKTESAERAAMWNIRQLYYKLSVALSDMETLPNFSGALYDRSFLDTCKGLNDPMMFTSLRACICSLATNIDTVEYQQEKRRKGKSKNNLFSLYQIALSRFTETTSIYPTFILIQGIAECVCGLAVVVVSLVLFLLSVISDFWLMGCLILGILLILIGILSINLGVLGQYVMKIHIRSMNRPSVIEADRLNYD